MLTWGIILLPVLTFVSSLSVSSGATTSPRVSRSLTGKEN